jgi:hypothetical protein
MTSENIQEALLPSRKPQENSTFFLQVAALFLICLILGITAWIVYSPILETPPDVLRSRDTFAIAKEIFHKNQKYWGLKRTQIENKISLDLSKESGEAIPSLIHEITPEMVLSYTTEILKIPTRSLNSLTFTPKISGSSLLILLSKNEQSTWPLPIILSLELEVRFTQLGMDLLFHRLRRGSQELAPTCTRSYFGSELDILKKNEMVSLKSPLAGH